MGYSKIIQNGQVVSTVKGINGKELNISMIDGNIDCIIVGGV